MSGGFVPADVSPYPPEPSPAQLRQAAYEAEADPVFFRWQRGEASEQDWLEVVQMIRDRHPDTE